MTEENNYIKDLEDRLEAFEAKYSDVVEGDQVLLETVSTNVNSIFYEMFKKINTCKRTASNIMSVYTSKDSAEQSPEGKAMLILYYKFEREIKEQQRLIELELIELRNTLQIRNKLL